MKINDIRLDLVNDNDGLVGFINCVIDDRIRVSSIAIHQHKNKPGYRLVYPRDKRGYLYYFPISQDLREEFENEIFKFLGARYD